MNIQKGDWVLCHEPKDKENYKFTWYTPASDYSMDLVIGKIMEIHDVEYFGREILRVTAFPIPIYGLRKTYYSYTADHLEKVEKPSEEVQEEV